MGTKKIKILAQTCGCWTCCKNLGKNKLNVTVKTCIQKVALDKIDSLWQNVKFGPGN